MLVRVMRAIVAAVLITACGGGGDDTPPDQAKWQLLGEHRPSSLLAVWASSLDDVWVVGGREGAGGKPTVFHFDGAAWSQLDTNMPNVDLWQVFGFANGPVFLAGSNGTILRFANNTFEKLTTPASDIVFGLWGSSPDDVWAVGGQTTGRAFAWHLNGSTFEAVPGVPAELETMGTVWKVTGRAANDVFMSASLGLILHWDGSAITNEKIGGEELLFSIGCSGTRCVSAGTNTTNGVLYQNDGAGWVSRVPTTTGPVWRGVTPLGDDTYVVGQAGAVIHLVDDTWVSDPPKLSIKTLHANWNVDGNVFAVGGDFDQAITAEGVLLFKGATELPPLP
jgi:hypothetical protein